jgi:lipopolysaccharide export system protein LptA
MKRLLHYTVAFLPLLCANLAVAQDAGNALGGSLLDKKAFDDGFGKLPTNITSDSLTFNAKNRIFVYKGNVIVTQGDMKLTANMLEGTYSEQNQLQKLIAKGDVFITKQDIEASGQLATYDAIASIITFTENPQLQQKESVLRADRIKIFLNENRSQAEGDVRVTFVNNKDAAKGLEPQKAVAPSPSPTPVATKTPAPKATTTKAPTKKKPTPKPTPSKKSQKKK